MPEGLFQPSGDVLVALGKNKSRSSAKSEHRVPTKNIKQLSTLGIQVPSQKVFGVGARRVQVPSEKVLGSLGSLG